MKRTILLVFASLFFGISLNAQTTSPNTTNKTSTETKRKSFRATKDQITQAQKMLKEKGKYTGAEDGTYSADFRASVKEFQGENGLRKSGSLNRSTLEKMGIELTDSQKEIPVNPNNLAGANDGTPKKRGPIFRATKDQVMHAQKMLKDGGMLTGEEEGKLDDATREALKKYQTENSLKSTGTLNQVTLEKMKIELTDRQKGIETPKTAKTETSSAEKPKRGPVFRANKDQVTEVQTKLKTGGMYSGEMTGTLDDATRDAIRKWQAANGVKVTGTLNKETLEKMGVELTDKQKEM
ncbi:MAG: peptidoglycan-binding domain-containing protein [Pyrinomonadaceae bacterium]